MTPDLSYELEGEREKKMCEDNKWNEQKQNKKKQVLFVGYDTLTYTSSIGPLIRSVKSDVRLTSFSICAQRESGISFLRFPKSK